MTKTFIIGAAVILMGWAGFTALSQKDAASDAMMQDETAMTGTDAMMDTATDTMMQDEGDAMMDTADTMMQDEGDAMMQDGAAY